MAAHLGTQHQEEFCDDGDIARVIPDVIWHTETPILRTAPAPMYILSDLVHKHRYKVVLTGEGADETLAGYLHHKVMMQANQYATEMPAWFQERVAKPLVTILPAGILNLAFSYPAELGGRGKQKLLDFLDLIGKLSLRKQYLFLISLFDERDKGQLYDKKMSVVHNPYFSGGKSYAVDNERRMLEEILFLQYRDWLPDDILMKQDKMSMANSIEGRVPFMDHKLVEFLLQTPPHLKLKGLVDKVLLRKYLGKVLPGKTAERKKKAFYIPLDQYLGKEPLKGLVEQCLSRESVNRRGYFRWERVHVLRENLGKGDFLYGKQVLALLALELWHRIFIDRESGWV